MKRLVTAVVAAAGIAATALFPGAAPTSAQAALIPCKAAPASYVAAFDGVDGVIDGAVSYPESRVFLEVQSHIIPPGETARHHFEHIHLGMCFPYAETWMQPANARTVDIAFVFHHVQDYNVVNFGGSFVAVGGSGSGFASTDAQEAELEAAMDASATSTQTVFQSYSSANITSNCRRTFRPVLNVVSANENALVDEWSAAGQWTTYIDYPGLPTCTPEFSEDQLRSRSWVPGNGYLYTTAKNLPSASQWPDDLTDSFDLTLAGSDSVTVDVHAHVDPNYHAHDADSPSGDNDGIWQQTYQVSGQVPIQVPVEGIPAGGHKLVLIGNRATHSSILVLPFGVAGEAGDTQAPSVPTDLRRVNPLPSSTNLAWSASTDDVGVVGYRVYRDGVQVADVTDTVERVFELSAETHLLEVEAYDAAGNVSERAPLTITRTWK